MKKKKKRIRISGLIFICLLIYLLSAIIYHFYNMPIKSIILSGNSNIKDSEVLKVLDISNDSKFILLNKKSLENKLVENEFIKEVNIDKNMDGTLKIDITESKPLFYDDISKKYILEDDETSNKVIGLPILVNDIPKDIRKLFIEKFKNIDNDIIRKISEIEYSPNIVNDLLLDEMRFIFKMNDKNIVHINIGNLEKINRYNDILEIEKRKGILYLDSNNGGHVFDLYE